MKTIVLGPPGTGKTTTLLNEVDMYLKQTDPDKIGFFLLHRKLLMKQEIEPCLSLIYQRMTYHILEHYTH